MLGSTPLPPSVQTRVDSTGGEVCTNVFLITQGSVLVTSEGLKIGALGGDWDQVAWDEEGKQKVEVTTEGEEDGNEVSTRDFVQSTCQVFIVSSGLRLNERFDELPFASDVRNPSPSLPTQKLIFYPQPFKLFSPPLTSIHHHQLPNNHHHSPLSPQLLQPV